MVSGRRRASTPRGSPAARWAPNPAGAGSLVQIQPPQPTLMSRVSGKSYYVYVLWSPRAERFYIGISENPQRRLEQHNCAGRGWTARHAPWQLVHSELYDYYSLAKRRELQLKAQKRGDGFWTATGLDPARFSGSSLGS